MSGAPANGPDLLAPLPKPFARLGLHIAADLLLHFPLRHEDETRLTPMRDLRPGLVQQVQGRVIRCDLAYRGRRQLQVTIEDDGGRVVLRFLHVYPGQAQRMAAGSLLRASGEVRSGLLEVEMVHPRWRVVTEDTPLPECLTPVYPVCTGVSQAMMRKLTDRLLARPDWADTVPVPVRERYGLAGFAESVLALHRPGPATLPQQAQDRNAPAWRRICFDELLAQQLVLHQARARRTRLGTAPMRGGGALSRALLERLPFGLTAAQQRVWQEIRDDLARPVPMQRLLQGDVGSGKTIVAALAAAQAIDCGFQAAFMAPTELLAEQHYRKLCEWFEPLGVQVQWLSGSLAARRRAAVVAALTDGTAQLVAGTHALFQDEVGFSRLGLAVVDEQHRFGVTQRLALRHKGQMPHQLMMSATPIPRTLAMSYHADLDVSLIDELPPGRTPVTTRLVADGRRGEVVDWLRSRCQAGAQAYWVCPLIEESETLQLQTAIDTHAMLEQMLPQFRVGLLHGRMRPADKAAVMAAFAQGEIALLVATTVIEVGVDVPNASLMVIEHAERMGLAQLHQLRGRVGRGAARSACLLLYREPLSELADARLKVIAGSTDGFHVAREDLRLRGPGEWLGARQSGAPLLRFADPLADTALVESVHEAAGWMLRETPGLAAGHIARWYGARQEYGLA